MSFFEKLFGGKKKEEKVEGAEGLLRDVLEGLIQHSSLELSFDLKMENSEEDAFIEFFGADEEALTAKEGQLLDAIQLFLKRVAQHQLPDLKVNIHVDCANFRKEADEALMNMADKLKEMALAKGRSVYFRALAPKDRKVVHQHLAEDGRVKSRSIGDGHFKKIKIYPVKGANEDLNEPSLSD